MRLFKTVLVFAVLALILTACSAPKPEGEEPAEQEQAEPKEVVMTHIESQDIKTIDPGLFTGDEASLIAIINMYDPLLSFKML